MVFARIGTLILTLVRGDLSLAVSSDVEMLCESEELTQLKLALPVA